MNRNDNLLNIALKTEQAGCRKDDTQCCGKCSKSSIENQREKLASENGMAIEFVNWFFDNKKDGCGNVWFMMMAAMWEGWAAREAQVKQLAAENAALKSAITDHSQSVHFCEVCGKDDPCSTDDVCYVLSETPATDAILASLRAEAMADGVIALADKVQSLPYFVGVKQQFIRNFAAQLRSKSEVQS